MSRNSKYIFCMPALDSLSSGGNIYNKKMMSLLREDHEIIHVDFDNLKPYIQKNNWIWLDSLYIYEPDHTYHYFGLIIHHLESMFCKNNEKNKFIEIEKNLILSSKKILSTSHYTSRYIKEKLNYVGSVFTIEPPIETIQSLRNPEENRNKFCILGNIINRKGVYNFLENFLRKVLKNDDFYIEIYGHSNGEDAYFNECIKILKSYNEKRIVIKSSVDHKNLKNIFENFSSLISPSLFETFGMSVHEAFFNKKILFCLDLDGYYTLKKSNFPMFKDIHSLVDGVLKFIRNASYQDHLICEAKNRKVPRCRFREKLKNFNFYFKL